MICKNIEFEKKISKSFNDYIINFINMKLDIDKFEIHLFKNKYNKTIKIIFEILI